MYREREKKPSVAEVAMYFATKILPWRTRPGKFKVSKGDFQGKSLGKIATKLPFYNYFLEFGLMLTTAYIIVSYLPK